MLTKSVLTLALVADGLMCKPPAFIAELTNSPRFHEILFVCLLAFMVYIYVTGKAQNFGIAKKVFNRLFGFFVENFAYIGTKHNSLDTLANDSETAANDTTILEPDYPYIYRVFLTGRESIKFMIANVVLNRRHDFITSTVYSIFWPEKDKLQCEFALSNDCQLKGLCYAVRAKHAKKAIEDFEDLRLVTKRLKPDSLSKESIAVFAENQEIADLVFDAAFSDLLNGHAGELLESIEITDCVPSEFHKGANAKLVVSLGKKSDEDLAKVEQILAAFLKAIDRIEAYQPTKKIAEEIEETRKKLVAMKEKQKKTESGEGAKSLAERYASMTPAEKKKFEEKEARKAKAKSKMIKMVKGA